MNSHTWPNRDIDQRAWDQAKRELGEKTPMRTLIARAQAIKQLLASDVREKQNGQSGAAR